MKKMFSFMTIFMVLFSANNTAYADTAISGITVYNQSYGDMQVSINQWGSNGSTEYFNIRPSHYEKWNRSDTRYFVMSIKDVDKILNYMIFAGSVVVINEHGAVFSNGTQIFDYTRHGELSGSSSEIKVLNHTTKSDIEVSINRWGSGGSTGMYNLRQKSDSGPSMESWARSDTRGFVLNLDSGALDFEHSLYVLPGDIVELVDGSKGELLVKINSLLAEMEED